LVLGGGMTQQRRLLDATTRRQNQLQRGVFASTHSLTQLQPWGSVPVERAQPALEDHFSDNGQLTLTKASDDGFSLIQKIRSRSSCRRAVDIERGAGIKPCDYF